VSQGEERVNLLKKKEKKAGSSADTIHALTTGLQFWEDGIHFTIRRTIHSPSLHMVKETLPKGKKAKKVSWGKEKNDRVD